MLPRVPQFRLFLPLFLTSALSFAFCVATAVFLLRVQSQSAEALGENIASFRESANLEESILDLAALLRTRVENVTTLHDRIQVHLAELVQLANHSEEIQAQAKIAEGYKKYLDVWHELKSKKGPDSKQPRTDALRILDEEVLIACQELRDYNSRQIDLSEQEHRNVVRGLAWGLAGSSGSAALAGLLLGYATARGINQSIRRLQVGLRDAAGKIANLPSLEITEEGNLNQLHDQVQSLVNQIEGVVAKLQQREREVLRAEQLAALGQLAAGMAHEIRNPLTSIKLLIQAASEEGPEGKLVGEDLGVVEREVRQMERSIQSFLDFARPPKLNKTPTELGQILERTAELIHGRAEKQRVEIVLEGVEARVLRPIDAGQIQQVVLNLAINSLDAMPNGGKLTLRMRQVGSDVEFAVIDTGPGVGVEMRQRLFQPFASSKPTGLGLGLSISRRIMEDHGGSLEIRDHVGGAYFLVRLPGNEEVD